MKLNRMKKQFILIILCAFSSTLFFSCKPKTVKTEEISFANRYYLSSDTSKGSLNVDFKVEIPVAYTNKAVLDSIRTTIFINLFGHDYDSRSNDSVLHLFARELETDYRANNEPLLNQLDNESLYSFNNEHILEGFSLLNDEHIYSYGIDRYVFMGGAHGLNNRTYLNFNLTTGELITESDLFVDNYKPALVELIKKRMVEEIVNQKNTELIINLEDTDYWTDSIVPNGNFYITDENITYVFNPYEIAPYYMGQTEVVIPFDRIKDLLRPENPIAYLLKTAQ
jgi:hypothetical protein